MNTTTYVTTSIPYVNGRPHVGFALELVQADVLARYNRLLGNRTRFQTGSDENAFKNVLSARQEGIPTQELVTRNSQRFRELAGALTISHDSFVRTTDEGHRIAVHEFWRRLNNGDIYQKNYTGLYCAGCEDFYQESDLVGGRCPDHDIAPVEIAERNYFFRLSRYQKQLENILSSGQLRVVPETRRNEILSFVRRGLQDISISRASDRSGGWGIQVPDDPSQIIYVWIDALINYVSGLGFGRTNDWDDYWTEDVRKIHVIGKNVWKFHAIYWPALLLSAGLPLPDEILVHGFLTENGQKISKSRGNSIDPLEYVAAYGTDSLRYYLLRAVSPFADGDFSTDRLQTLHNSDLANGLGNLVSRIATLCHKADYGAYPTTQQPDEPREYRDALQRFEFDAALKHLWSRIARLNQDIDRKEPWKALKSEDKTALHQDLTGWLAALHRIAYWLQPFLPTTSAAIQKIIAHVPIRRCPPLFPRV